MFALRRTRTVYPRVALFGGHLAERPVALKGENRPRPLTGRGRFVVSDRVEVSAGPRVSTVVQVRCPSASASAGVRGRDHPLLLMDAALDRLCR
jgi:hypothetical protein